MEKELLHKYFRGDTSPQEEKQVMDWAEASAGNYRQYLEERKIWNALLIHYTTSAEKASTFSAQNKSFILWKIGSIAASIALLISLSWIIFTANKEEPQSLQAVMVPAGQRVQLVLGDGTKVWLNSKSTFTYPTSFGKNIREVELDGEGYFEVTKNEKAPFIVKTRKYDIKVLGTTFNVSAYQNKLSAFETSLLEGAIDVSTGDQTEWISLTPNEKVTEIDGILQKDTINNPEHLRWREGLICLDDEPFENLMRKFAVYYGIDIVINNPNVLKYKCTGKFRQTDGIEYALRVLQKDVKFKYLRNDELNSITII
ncbi:MULTISPECIES: FecR family protein [Parabacteroides]|jgi:hypothetical protein|uniref:Ferric-dicitrate binding protein FerR (Iron transport regulator) n=1 Tax=Parabacteroides faecis TaxID=1217282 RepID=A0ABR6KH25_9BACT|nr:MULTISPECIES: FecR family protein [Parabacteroides]MBB4620187.1 ferric-dicitrate binding protein FerR (iron transport regulator) [Parabacteroides faecis]MBC8617817.1 FecR family protein [Parabacteroides faecis]RHR42192.1 FecR family protein [Parabacteroides sp. AF18-52]RHR93791.1 FecR family protein [Parabacteroides sp. AF14-59]GGJ95577.1 anti-sigma factor [Parabacteroides faecis]